MKTSKIQKNVTVRKLREYSKSYGSEQTISYPFARVEKQANTEWLVCMDEFGLEERRFKVGTKLLCGWSSEKQILPETAKRNWAKARKKAEAEAARAEAEFQAERAAEAKNARIRAAEYIFAFAENIEKVREAGIKAADIARLWDGDKNAWKVVNHAINLIGNQYVHFIGWKTMANDIQKELE